MLSRGFSIFIILGGAFSSILPPPFQPHPETQIKIPAQLCDQLAG
jgi:hypothetical protein